MAIDKITTPAVTDDSVTLAKMAPGTDGNIISYDASGNPVAIATGNDGQVLTSTGAGSPPAFETLPVGGITMADQWRTSANAFINSSNDITANWERVDTDSYGTIGSAMSQSSGIFTFPSTGIYLVQALVAILPDGVRTIAGAEIRVTTNNSGYSSATDAYQHTTAQNYNISVYMSFILDVTDTSNVKLKLSYSANGSATVVGDSGSTRTGMTFIRLGDT